jgi:adenylosuccinate lyase
MPHKVNPIDFENSEGNLGVANALLEHMAAKLQVSRWQRDLSDSTVLRNIGAAFGHCSVAYQASLKGLSRLRVNEEVIRADLDASWEVLGEAVQTVMRKHGLSEPYERLKAATRGQQLDAASFARVLDALELPPAARAELADLTPATYVGLAAELARREG